MKENIKGKITMTTPKLEAEFKRLYPHLHIEPIEPVPLVQYVKPELYLEPEVENLGALVCLFVAAIVLLIGFMLWLGSHV